ncbi:hypothetical protein BH10PSE2_BH10PSE2_18290 [soil metagenome]
MTNLFHILVEAHDWRMTVLAVIVSVLGVTTSLGLGSIARKSHVRGVRLRFGAGAAGVAAAAVWGAHFVALLGFTGAGPMLFDTGLTLLSLIIAFGSFSLGVAICVIGATRPWRIFAALVIAAGVVAMQLTGASGLRFAGHVVWDPVSLIAAIAVSFGFAIAAGIVYGQGGLKRLILSSLCGAACVLSLHYGAISAMTFVFDPRIGIDPASVSQPLLLIGLVTAVLGVIATAAVVTAFAWISRRSALEHLREALDAMPDGLAFYDAEDRLMVWNQRYAEVNPELIEALVVGVTFSEMLQIGIDKGLYADAVGREQAWIEERVAARARASNSLEQQIADGRWLRVQDRRTAAGGTVTVCNDITELKQDASSLSQARDTAETANRAKSEFLANMSHEIRTPLNGVIGLAQALARTELTPQQQEMLDLIQSSGQTLQTLLSDILDLARVESGRMEIADEPFDLRRAVEQAAQLYAATAAEKGLSFFVDIEPEADVWIRGDVVRVKQVLTNLVSNAVKFTTIGFVSLTASRGSGPDGGPILRFTVEDTGVGFDSEARDRLFTRFEQADGTITRRFGGTGLGLAICRQLADMMGGSLDCESEPGGGSAFILTIPMREAAEPAAELAPVEAEHDEAAPRIRVLLADDHPTNRRVVELVLSAAPVDLTSVEDGAQALAAYRASAFDLVLMDMQMPVMDGLTATREIRLHELALGLHHTPIVMLTANALADHVAAGVEAGADRHLSKPFDAGDLLTLVAELGGARRVPASEGSAAGSVSESADGTLAA